MESRTRKLCLLLGSRPVLTSLPGRLAHMKTRKRKSVGTKRTSNEILRDMPKLGGLYKVCMANSGRLVEAAKILEKQGFYAQAFFLALTAWEEMGKAQVVADYSEDCVSREEFDEAFRKHFLKNAYLERKVEFTTDSSGKTTDATISYDLERGKGLAKWREHALYVSVTEGFVAWSPETQISDKQCRKLIDEIEGYTAYLRHMEAITERIGIKALTK
jgi:AbiV family abortive infection protein